MNNYHPLFVHFPIALLTLYSLLELLPDAYLRKIKGFTISLFLLLIGVISSWPAYLSGEGAEDLKPNMQHVIDKHETFASLTIWLYTASLIIYILNTPLAQEKISKFLGQTSDTLTIFKKISSFLYSKFIRVLLALSALIAISITGALGGAITHGPDVDFVVEFVYNLFF